MRWKLAMAMSLALLAGCAAGAAAEETVEPAAKPKELRISVKENRVFRFEKDQVTIKGSIQLVQGDVQLTASDIQYDTKKKFAILLGGTKLVQEDLTLSGDQFSAWFDEEKYVIETKVRLVKKEKAPEQGDKLVLTADRLEYDSKSRSMLATGNASVQEKDRTASAQRVDYRDKESRVILEGGVVVRDEDDKTIHGERIVIDLDRDVVEVEGPVEVEFRL